MRYFTRSLLTYLKTLCHPILKNRNTRELRVFLSSLPPAAVKEVGNELSEYWLKSKRDIDFQFIVAYKLWRQWEETADGQILEQIKSAGWVDTENRLTHYRNLEWTPESGKDGLIVMLVGVEQATDQGSLEDFYQVGVDTIWKEEMQSRFKGWLERFLYDKQIDPEETHLEAMEELLETLRRHAAGDLIRISDFLEWIDFTSVMDSYAALTAFYGNLSFWGLPFLHKMKGSKWKKYVEAAIDFFSYQKYFNENDRKKAIQKVEDFRVRPNKEPTLDLRGAFGGEDELLDCIKIYVEYNDPEARRRLLHFDFAVLKDEILGYTYTQPEPELEEDEDEGKEDKIKEPKGFKTLHGPPLEAILTALWQTLIDFRFQCTRKKKSPIQPFDALKGIYLRGLKFVDFDNDNKELARGLLGGIDAFLEKYIGPIAPESEEGKDNAEFSSGLLDMDSLPFGQTKTAVPHFQFDILFKSDIRGLSVRRKFKWALPETHPFRNLLDMARAIHEVEKPSFWLPVYHIQHYPELFFAPDETEIHRVLRAGLSKLTIANLFENLQNIDLKDLSKLGIADLSDAYAKFLGAMVDEGYFSALQDHWIDGSRLYYRYENVIQNLIQKTEFQRFRPIVYKAFLLTEKPKAEEAANFPWARFVPHAAVTALHPALMGMLNHREAFLAHAWLERATFFLNDDSSTKITENTWRDICDLATINYPLFGLVSTPTGALDTRVASFGHIHLVGKPPAQSGPLSSKILQQYDTPEDDDIKDAALFRETRESRVISQILKEYARIYPHAEDGISLVVLNPANIQAIIAGVDDFLHQKLKKERAEEARDYPPYHLSLSLFMHVAESGEVSRWLSEWRKRWDPAEGATRYEFYQNCRLSVSQKVITQPDDYLILMKNGAANVDIAVLTRFMDTGEPSLNYEKTSPYKPDLDHLLKFPILEAPRCEDKRQSFPNLRSRIISNRRFRLAALHSELSVRLWSSDVPPDREHIVLSQSDFTPWAKIVDQMHRNASWVLCLDPSVDTRLIQKGSLDAQSEGKREIIGFASGVGAHGELNYTLSTERASLLDVQKMIQKRVNNLFGPWEPVDSENAARFLVREARKLSGISLVRATGRGEQVRDLIAYALVRRCLPVMAHNGPTLCDELVVLDAFPHWFTSIGGGREMYPDLLRISASLAEDGLIDVHATILECKISSNINRHIQKARSQLENGLHHLVARFRPKGGESNQAAYRFSGSSPIFRFDQRFWWAQLQRLIASKAVVENAELELATTALESLGEGRFRIQWKAAALTIWTEPTDYYNSDFFQTVEVWSFQQEGCEIAIPLISCGGALIRRIGRGNYPVALPLKSSETPPTSSPQALTAANLASTSQPIEPSDTLSPAEESASAETKDQDDGTPGSQQEGGESLEKGETTSPISTTVTRTPPNRLFLGVTDAKREIYWEFGHPELTNRHILIFGKSGVGKTYAIQALLLEMGLNGQNSIIVDYTNGFLPDHLEPVVVDILKPETHLVRQKPLPINPFRKQEQRITGFDPIPEDSHTVGGRIATVINSVYSNVGEQQRAVLIETIAAGLDEEGAEFRFPALLERLKEQGASGLTLANKLSPMVHMKLFGQDEAGNWDRLYGSGEVRANILQLAGVPRDIARIATEFILWDLYDYAANSGRKDVPLPIVLDEIQNLDHRLDAPLGKFLTEGRKFGLSLILATQTLSNLKGEERDRLFQASHKLFFKPAETEVKEYARILEQGSYEKAETWIARLNKLNRGECYSLGPTLNPGAGELENKIFKIHISSLQERLKKDSDND